MLEYVPNAGWEGDEKCTNKSLCFHREQRKRYFNTFPRFLENMPLQYLAEIIQIISIQVASIWFQDYQCAF
jgi:hypothetical protein